MTLALAGNPNSGKTTLFNRLTGTRQHVGNYPGVTVEKKEGRCRHGQIDIHVVDLPGTYGLTAYSMDEVVARDYVVTEKPDVVVHVVDSSNLERNLYLAVELIELGAPLVLAFNMSDVAGSRGVVFDLEKLSMFFGAPIVQTVGHKGRGVAELLDAAVAVASGQWHGRKAHVAYSREVEAELEALTGLVAENAAVAAQYGARWVALKLLERDQDMHGRIDDAEILRAAGAAGRRIERHFGDPPEIVVADQRYGFISGACQEAVRITAEARHRFSDRVDQVVTNRFLGIPIFLALMYLVFQLTFTVGQYPMRWIELLFEALGAWATTWWPRGQPSVVRSLIVDGIIGGVGGVIVFLPNIALLFLAIAVLEDSGYMARAAFVMDHLMHKIGLHGKSFIPMLIGFGCTVPAIMATRTLESRRGRLTTMLVLPLMSCGARLPIYALIIPAFFPQTWHAPMLWLMYIIGIVLAIACVKLLRVTLFRGESEPFVMELPPYRVPTARGALLHMWERSWLYLRKAGTIILAVSIILWAMTSYPKKQTFDEDYDGLKQEARARYQAEVKVLEAAMEMPDSLLSKAVQAELDMADEQEKWHRHQDGYRQAEEQRDATLEKLERAEGGERLATFLEIRDGVLKAEGDFRRVVEREGLEEDTLDYRALDALRKHTLHRLSERDPRIYGYVVQYLGGDSADSKEGKERIKAAYDKTLTKLDQSRQTEELTHSAAGRIGHALAFVLEPIGFDWRIGTALIGSFAAKEVFVAQMGIVFSLGEADESSQSLRAVLRREYRPLIGFCIMLFCLISTPCVATIAITKRESGAWRWALLQLGGLTAIAYLLTLVVYQVGNLLGA